ncbi:MAG: hypothetical protein PHY47_27910, partial [Lachnospiraceae bacterium]|nr:hypothetical protein [Lachnospiraceae bacterium]
DEPARGAGNVPEEYAGMSFLDLINSNMGNRNQIPVVNQIVSAKNPEDEKIYVTYFTDNQITCQNGDGTTAWEMKLNNEEQSDKIKEFFEKYKPDRAEVKEYFSDIKLGGVSSKDFWLDILGKD